MRVVSLVPSLTETVATLGGADLLVGRTSFCPRVRGPAGPVPALGGTKTPDLQRILDLAPDLVLLDRDENRREDADALRAAGIELLVAEVADPRDVPAFLRDLARQLDLPAGRDEASRLEEALAALPPPPEHPPGALVPAWRDPWVLVARETYAGNLLDLLGLAVVPEGPPRYPRLPLPEAAALRPELVLLPDEPYRFTRNAAAPLLDAIATARGTPPRAVPLDGRDLFWYGARTREALARLSRKLRGESPDGPPSTR